MSADVLLVSLGSTHGLRVADEAFAGSLRRTGLSVEVVVAEPPPELRTMALVELAWAWAARRAAVRGIAAHAPRTVVYSSTTAALLWPRPGVIRFDALAAGNRPGRDGLWQRPVERRRLAAAPLLLPWSAGALAERRWALRVPARLRRTAAAAEPPSVVVPVPVTPSDPEPDAGLRGITAITYAANPHKKGLDRVLAAWRAARRDGEELLVAGLEGDDEPGVRHLGSLPAADYRALLRRSRVFVTAPRREDYGLAQLEALADGCLLVTTPAPGPYAALPLARELDRRLVSEDLVTALREALDAPRLDYPSRAAALLEPWSAGRIDALVREAVLPLLGKGSDPSNHLEGQTL